MSTEKVRIKLKAYDHRVLDDAVTRIVETVKRSGGEVVGALRKKKGLNLWTDRYYGIAICILLFPLILILLWSL